MRFRLIATLTLTALGLNGVASFAQPSGNAHINTNFFRGPALTAQEVGTVIELARQCGLEQPESVADVRILPNLKSVPRSLIVTSAERVDGRKATRYSVRIGGTNWSRASLGSETKRLGGFYVNPPYLRTNELSLVRYGTNVARMVVAADIPLQLADTIVEKFVRRDVQLSNEQLKSEWSSIDVSEPTALSRDRVTGAFRIYFGSPYREEVVFKWIGDRVTIIYISGEVVY
jgi:hypothetical protein